MKVEHIIEVNAPATTMWATTIDVENWSAWTPTVEKTTRLDSGPFGVGSSARMKQPNLPEAVWTVTSIAQGQGFVWETHMRGMRFIATHHTTPTSTGCTNLLALELKGVLAFLLWPIAKRQALQTLATENNGLKNFCEKKSPA